MILQSDKENIKVAICHEACSDGTASSMIIHEALPNVEIKFATYGTKEYANIPAVPGMLFCDIIPPEERVEEFVQAGAIVLDHHKGVESIVEKFGDRGVFADEDKMPGVSGAVLAYREIMNPRTIGLVKQFSTLIGIRDTWQKDHPLWEDACLQYETLAFYPVDYWLGRNGYKPHHPWLYSDEQEFGVFLMIKHRAAVASAVKNAYKFTVGGFKCAVFQGGKSVASDAAEILRADGVDIVAGFNFLVEGQPKMIFSIRTSDKVNASDFAKLFYGNGHTRAAGYRFDILPTDPNPFVLFETMVLTYIYSKEPDDVKKAEANSFIEELAKGIGSKQAQQYGQQLDTQFSGHDNLPDLRLLNAIDSFARKKPSDN